MKAACAFAGLAVGLYLGSSWERFAFQDDHSRDLQRAAFCQGELAQLLTSASQCEGRLESVSLELAGSNAGQIVEARMLRASR